MKYLENCKKILGGTDLVYMCVATQFANPWPIIDEDGYVNIYDSKNEAKIEEQKTGFLLQELPSKVLFNILDGFRAYGISKVKIHVNNEVKKVNKELFEDEKESKKADDMFNSSLQFAMIRFLQAQASNIEESKKEALVMKLWKEISDKLQKTLLFMPISYESDDLSKEVSDNTIHTYDNALYVLKELKKKGIFVEFENYSYYTGNEGNMMYARSITNPANRKEYLPLYTDFYEMMSQWKNKARVAVVTFEDVKNIYIAFDSVVINPSGICFEISPITMQLMDY